MLLGYSLKNMGINIDPLGYYSQQLDPVAQGYPAPCIAATALLVKATEEIVTGSSLTVFAP